MASILFLGYSNLLKNRILPILHRVGFESVAIAKFEGQSWDNGYKYCQVPVMLFDSYEEGLAQFKDDLVYVSTVNSTHFEYAVKSLDHNFHTIIDKPATLTLGEANKIVKLAQNKGLLLSEATVYLQHPQLSHIDSIFVRNEDEPKLLTVHFSMPPFIGDNFRYHKEFGGGAIYDTAPYVVSIGRYFFREMPISVSTVINESLPDGVEMEYSLMMQYPNGKCLIGHFGFNTEYVNQVVLMGSRIRVELNRIFTIPENMKNVFTVVHQNQITQETTEVANNFELYLKDILLHLQNKEYDTLYTSMFNDASVRDMIIKGIK